LANYFVGQHSEADIATYLQAALSGGNTLYMPQVPLNDVEARALAAFIQSIAQAPASPLVVQAKE
jgi:hypothetical protein